MVKWSGAQMQYMSSDVEEPLERLLEPIDLPGPDLLRFRTFTKYEAFLG